MCRRLKNERVKRSEFQRADLNRTRPKSLNRNGTFHIHYKTKKTKRHFIFRLFFLSLKRLLSAPLSNKHLHYSLFPVFHDQNLPTL